MRNDELVTKHDRDADQKGRAAVAFNVAEDHWQRIFGKGKKTVKGRYIWDSEQMKLVPEAEYTPPADNLPAVHDDRLYRGYNPALRMNISGRTHLREELKRRNYRMVQGGFGGV